MSCALTALLTNGLVGSGLSGSPDTVGRAAGEWSPPFFTQGELKVNDEKPGNTAVFGSGGGVVMEFLSLKQAALGFNSGKGSHPA